MARTTREQYNITSVDIVGYLIRNSSQNKLVSINDIAMYFAACNEAARSKGVADFHDLTDADIVQAVAQMNQQTFSCVINDPTFVSIRTQVKRMLKKLLGREILPGVTVFEAPYTHSGKSKGELLSDVEMFYVQTPLNEVQVNLLRDAISVFPYAKPTETAEIIEGLNCFTPEYNRADYWPELVNAEKYQGEYYENLNTIRKAFSPIKDEEDAQKQKVVKNDTKVGEYRNRKRKKIKKISFKYYEYNENKELVLRKLRGSETRVVDPIKVMWANGYYYLVTIGYSTTHKKLYYTNYRIDRMKDVQCLAEDAESFEDKLPASERRALALRRVVSEAGSVSGTRLSRLKGIPNDIKELARRLDNRGFAVSRYRYSNPVMHTGGREKEIVLRCEKYMMNSIIDTFGFDIHTKIEVDSGKVLVVLRDTATAGVKLFALEYGEGVEVLSPLSLRSSVAETVSKMNAVYNS